MVPIKCSIGELTKSADGIVTLTITCRDKEITKAQMVEAVSAIDLVAQKPSPLLVDTSQPHSVEFDAFYEMANAANVLAVAMYAPSHTTYLSAESIEQFQNLAKKATYPFRSFSDPMLANQWLLSVVQTCSNNQIQQPLSSLDRP